MTTAIDDRYRSGEYLEATPSWHLEDSPFKARQVLRMIGRAGLDPQSICEIGCGAGGILDQLQRRLGASVSLTGYDVSPQAHAISRQFRTERLQFVLGDAFADERHFDLVLVMDVVEHVEDCFEFLRQTKHKGTHKIFHIPLEIFALGALRDTYLTSWHKFGHLHRFSPSTALEALRYTGHEIVDYFYSAGAIETGTQLKTRVLNVGRRLLPEHISARLFGGYSLLILTR